ncbi:MAG: hypothetical protein JO303_06620 [Caulobacteraceae bacterium]|nr:hypothetical protein [Caulobacteraceae bacterium]
MILKPGSRWKSAVSNAEVVVVRAPKDEAALASGGHPMVAFGAQPPAGLSAAADLSEELLVGKRYFDEESGTEILCSKAGVGSLTLNERPLLRRDAKPLPASD